jgi:hypothetical protein
LRFPKHARPHVDSASHLFFSVFSVSPWFKLSTLVF